MRNLAFWEQLCCCLEIHVRTWNSASGIPFSLGLEKGLLLLLSGTTFVYITRYPHTIQPKTHVLSLQDKREEEEEEEEEETDTYTQRPLRNDTQ